MILILCVFPSSTVSFLLFFRWSCLIQLFVYIVALESQEATVVYLPYLTTTQTIIDQIAVAGFKATVKSKPSPLQLSPAELERLVSSQRSLAVSPTSETSEETETEMLTDSTLATLRVTGMHCRSCVVNIQVEILLMICGCHTVQCAMQKYFTTCLDATQ